MKITRTFLRHSDQATEVILNMSKRALAQGSECPPLKPGTLRLYSMRFCPYAQRTRLVLEHKGIPYEEVNINLKFKPDWFLRKTLIGKVPVLEKDEKIVYESTVCNEYIDEVYPHERLTPSDAYTKARHQILMEVFDNMTGLFYKVRRPGEKHKAMEAISIALQPFEAEKGRMNGPYFGGDSVCLLDFHIWPWFERMEFMKDVGVNSIPREKFPNLNRWVEHIKELPAAKRTYLEPTLHARFFGSFAAGYPDYDAGLHLSHL